MTVARRLQLATAAGAFVLAVGAPAAEQSRWVCTVTVLPSGERLFSCGIVASPSELPAVREVYFDVDEAEVSHVGREALALVAADWIECRRRVVVEAHADGQVERRLVEPALELATLRAEEVKRVLVELGVPEAAIETFPFGREVPACNEQTVECQAANRRADVGLRR